MPIWLLLFCRRSHELGHLWQPRFFPTATLLHWAGLCEPNHDDWCSIVRFIGVSTLKDVAQRYIPSGLTFAEASSGLKV